MSNKPLTRTEWMAALDKIGGFKHQTNWVSLTDEDIAMLDWESFATKRDCVQAIEVMLKEKNT
jgi:hypothetical protein